MSHLLGFKSFEAAQPTLVGIKPIHMLRKRQGWFASNRPHTKTYDRIIPTAQHRAISTLACKTNHIERFNNTLRQRVSRLWHVFPSALHVFRTIPTFCASMAQKARDTCAIVLWCTH